MSLRTLVLYLTSLAKDDSAPQHPLLGERTWYLSPTLYATSLAESDSTSQNLSYKGGKWILSPNRLYTASSQQRAIPLLRTLDKEVQQLRSYTNRNWWNRTGIAFFWSFDVVHLSVIISSNGIATSLSRVENILWQFATKFSIKHLPPPCFLGKYRPYL